MSGAWSEWLIVYEVMENKLSLGSEAQWTVRVEAELNRQKATFSVKEQAPC